MERLKIMLEKEALQGIQNRKTEQRINRIPVASTQTEFKMTNSIQGKSESPYIPGEETINQENVKTMPVTCS